MTRLKVITGLDEGNLRGRLARALSVAQPLVPATLPQFLRVRLPENFKVRTYQEKMTEVAAFDYNASVLVMIQEDVGGQAEDTNESDVLLVVRSNDHVRVLDRREATRLLAYAGLNVIEDDAREGGTNGGGGASSDGANGAFSHQTLQGALLVTRDGAPYLLVPPRATVSFVHRVGAVDAILISTDEGVVRMEHPCPRTHDAISGALLRAMRDL